MLPSFRLSLVLGIVAAQLANGFQCPDEPLVSCSEDLRHEEELSSCCANHPAGLFSYTQTWDSEEGKWLAGHLRLLNCDGSEFRCEVDPARQYDANTVSTWLGHAGDHTDDGQHRVALAGKTDIGRYVAQQWSGSGACISTLSPTCTTSDSQFGIRLFYRALDTLSSELDTSRFLATKRIYPSGDGVYDRKRLLDALFDGAEGKHPYIECEGESLKHVEYRFVARGPFQDLRFEPPQHVSWSTRDSHTTCPLKGIKYLPKSSPRQTNQFNDSSSSKIKQLSDKRTPNLKSLKFFKHRHGQRMPEEDVWRAKAEAADAGNVSRSHDEL
ncbi:ribonuclease T2-like [Tulasnella sp. 424]|nr:ribonuclease T2-like [Tulasnella sp. 424]KAG8972862.1 ribonuclease T2-like [Tulasnella sp. 425]